MTSPKETPASQRQQAEGITGARCSERNVAPEWARRRVGASLLRFRGEYVTPGAVNLQAALEAAEARLSRGGPQAVCHDTTRPPGASTSENPGTHPADRYSSPRNAVMDIETGELLPCRSLETTQPRVEPKGLSGPHKKVAAALSWNVAHLCQKFGVERVGFLTLTFADHVTDVRESSRRFNSLASHVLRERYGHFIRVLERQKSGRIHYHLLVVLRDDIRTGADFDAFAEKNYKSANNHLRREWAYWRKTACFYGFGRTELMPIRSDAAAMGQYVGKYIGKHIGQREDRDKGARLVSYSGDARMATSKHSVHTNRPDQWRAKVLTFSRLVASWKPHARIRCMEDLSFHLGPRWAYQWRDFIMDLAPADLTVPF